MYIFDLAKFLVHSYWILVGKTFACLALWIWARSVFDKGASDMQYIAINVNARIY